MIAFWQKPPGGDDFFEKKSQPPGGLEWLRIKKHKKATKWLRLFGNRSHLVASRLGLAEPWVLNQYPISNIQYLIF